MNNFFQRLNERLEAESRPTEENKYNIDILPSMEIDDDQVPNNEQEAKEQNLSEVLGE